jgi:hypothetical protein
MGEFIRKNLQKFTDFLVKKVRSGSGFGTIIPEFPARESLVSDIRAGDGKIANLFLQCAFPDDSRSVSMRYLCQPCDIFTPSYLQDRIHKK